MPKTENTCIRGCANVDMINKSIDQLKELQEDVTETCHLLSLTGNETRFKILFLIKNNNRLCVCDMSDILGISISAVSQQLSKLKKGGLLSNSKEGQTIYYSIDDHDMLLILRLLSHIFENDPMMRRTRH